VLKAMARVRVHTGMTDETVSAAPVVGAQQRRSSPSLSARRDHRALGD